MAIQEQMLVGCQWQISKWNDDAVEAWNGKILRIVDYYLQDSATSIRVSYSVLFFWYLVAYGMGGIKSSICMSFS